MRLAEGRYLVRASYGYARAEDTFAVNGSKTEKTISLNAGTIAAEGMLAQGAGAAEGVFFILSRRRQGGGLEELGRSSELPAIFHVNAGEVCAYGLRRTRRTQQQCESRGGQGFRGAGGAQCGGLGDKDLRGGGVAQYRFGVAPHLSGCDRARKKGGTPLTVEGGVHRVQLPAGTTGLKRSTATRASRAPFR